MPETTADKKQKRLKILEADEIETVYGLPVFDDEDRALYWGPEELASGTNIYYTFMYEN